MPITTIPSSLGSVLATGYWPLTVTVTVFNPLRDKLLCYWSVVPNILSQFTIGSARSCNVFSNTALADITCINAGNLIKSNLTFKYPLRNGMLIIGFGCYSSRNFSILENYIARLRSYYVTGKISATKINVY